MVIDLTIEIVERGVVIERGCRVIRSMLRVSNIGTIDLKLDITILEIETTSTVVRCQKLNGVIKGKFLGGSARSNHLLSLGYEHVLGCVRESGTLIGVEVNELSMNLIIGSCGGCPPNMNLYIVIL